jgi:hypothetical protein
MSQTEKYSARADVFRSPPIADVGLARAKAIHGLTELESSILFRRSNVMEYWPAPRRPLVDRSSFCYGVLKRINDSLYPMQELPTTPPRRWF